MNRKNALASGAAYGLVDGIFGMMKVPAGENLGDEMHGCVNDVPYTLFSPARI